MKGYTLQGIDFQDEDDDDSNSWTFLGSLFYCFTVVTTIGTIDSVAPKKTLILSLVRLGYGNLYPITMLGRFVTIIYGLLGIPLTLYYLAEVGKLLTLVMKWLLRKKWPDYDSSEDFNFGPCIAVGMTLLYLLLGGVLFDLLEEDWGLIEGTYFSFISFSTIGFGDLVPEGQGYMLLLMLYCLSALSLCSMCFVVIQNAAENFLVEKQEMLTKWWKEKRRKRAEAQAKKDDGRKISLRGNRPHKITEEEEVEDSEILDEEM